MEPNAKVRFTHTDGDGDEIQFITTRPDRLTVIVTESGTASHAYLSRDGAAVLRDALAKWLDGSGSADPGGWAGATAELEEDPAPYRLDALKLAVQLAPVGADRHRVFQVAEEFARYIAAGETPGSAQADVPPLLTFVDAAPKTDCFCGHPTSEHKRHGCMRWDESGREYCSCKRTPGSFDAAPPAPEEVAGVTTCGVCSHPYHGVVVCADGAPGTAHVDRCQCRGRAEDYQR